MTAGLPSSRLRRSRVEDGLPMLSAGRHHWPRREVCLMEYTALLAGERRSDHPRCTDPVVAAIARAVNDYSSDAARQRLAVVASDLASTNGGGDPARHVVARRCLLTALPYATGDRKRVLVIALLGLDRAAAGGKAGSGVNSLTLDSELALVGAQRELADASAWIGDMTVGVGEHRRRGLPYAVEMAVATIADEADQPEADEVMHRLLVDCVRDYRAIAAGSDPVHRPTVRSGRSPWSSSEQSREGGDR